MKIPRKTQEALAAKGRRKAALSGGGAQILQARPELRKTLDMTTGYAVREGVALDAIPLSRSQPEPFVVLLAPDAGPGYGSLIQLDEGRSVVGGFTFQRLAKE